MDPHGLFFYNKSLNSNATKRMDLYIKNNFYVWSDDKEMSLTNNIALRELINLSDDLDWERNMNVSNSFTLTIILEL